ncbi:MAG: hypothetical protein ACLVE5_09000 [Clostridium perfringens]
MASFVISVSKGIVSVVVTVNSLGRFSGNSCVGFFLITRSCAGESGSSLTWAPF